MLGINQLCLRQKEITIREQHNKQQKTAHPAAARPRGAEGSEGAEKYHTCN